MSRSIDNKAVLNFRVDTGTKREFRKTIVFLNIPMQHILDAAVQALVTYERSLHNGKNENVTVQSIIDLSRQLYLEAKQNRG